MKSKKMKGRMEKKMLKKQVIWNMAAIALIIVVLNTGILIYPTEDMQTRNTTLYFRWFGFPSYVLVDDNPGFTSPVIAEKNEAVELKPGIYYWCVPFFKNCLKKTAFEIQSEVSLTSKGIQTNEENATYYVENTGNTPTKIEVKNLLGRFITGLFVLEPGSSNIVKINETGKIIATQQ